jgi:lipopolysaccharide transport system permease protein
MPLVEEVYDVIIEPGRSEKNYWRDIWRYRELFYILSWRDIKIRYKQTSIGAAWSIIRPLLTMLIFTVVFGRIAKLPSAGDTPYMILVYAAMLPWQFFANALSEGSNSLVGNANLISKVYFPRLIVPASSVIVSFIDFLISFAVLVLLFAYYRFIPSWHIVFLPAFLLLAFATALGTGLVLTTLNVKYRDFRYIIPFIVQFGMYISPVGFSSQVVPEQWRLVYSINPLVGIIDGFRWCIIGDSSPIYWPGLALSVLTTVCFIWVGVTYFRKTEKTFADVI